MKKGSVGNIAVPFILTLPLLPALLEIGKGFERARFCFTVLGSEHGAQEALFLLCLYFGFLSLVS